MPSETAPPLTVLVGHPFAPIGMGEVLRSTFRSLRAARVPVRVLDVYGHKNPDPDLHSEFGPHMTDRLDSGANVFCINGDEVSPVFAHLGERAEGGRRIIYPAWELPRYPAVWARELERFDEVWGFSAYTAASLAGSVSVPVRHIPLATQPRRPRPLGRRTFGIPEGCYAFLFFFDLRSYIERKNPDGALMAFQRVLEARPGLDLRFVVKVNGSDMHPEQGRAFLDRIRPFGDRVVLLDRTMTDAEAKGLHLCCDAFVSLHRCEGYGFGLAEATYFGKPAVATGYSGNMDFMTPDTSYLVDYRLVSVPDGAYPHWEDQVWAEPNIEQAAAAMIALADDPVRGRALGAAASRHMRAHFNHAAIGLRYAARLAGREPEAAPRVPAQIVPKAPLVDGDGAAAGGARMREILAAAEQASERGTVEDALATLRSLTIEAFGYVMISMPDPTYPTLSAALPRMADEQVQRDWTGNAGASLLLQTLSFVRSVEHRFAVLTGAPLRGRRILDYGCGYGRILRLMYYFSAPERTFGVDPWDRSIEICRADGLPSNLAVSDYLPRSLPVGDARFGLIYAFSVFTHTSERATREGLTTLRQYIEPDGVLVITIRPRVYWETVSTIGHAVDAARMLADHDGLGFAFTPHDRMPLDGDVTYGDTTIAPGWFAENAKGWRIAAQDHWPDDPLQIIVYLTPA